MHVRPASQKVCADNHGAGSGGGRPAIHDSRWLAATRLLGAEWVLALLLRLGLSEFPRKGQVSKGSDLEG